MSLLCAMKRLCVGSSAMSESPCLQGYSVRIGQNLQPCKGIAVRRVAEHTLGSFSAQVRQPSEVSRHSEQNGTFGKHSVNISRARTDGISHTAPLCAGSIQSRIALQG